MNKIYVFDNHKPVTFQDRIDYLEELIFRLLQESTDLDPSIRDEALGTIGCEEEDVINGTQQ